jgi:hypothetical protein
MACGCVGSRAWGRRGGVGSKAEGAQFAPRSVRHAYKKSERTPPHTPRKASSGQPP